MGLVPQTRSASGVRVELVTRAVTQLHQSAKGLKHEKDGKAQTAQTSKRQASVNLATQAFDQILQFLTATTPRQLSLIAWSVAQLHPGCPDCKHSSIFQQVGRRVTELDMQGISMVMWSLAVLSDASTQSTQPLFHLLALRASTKLPEFSTQGISNVLWSCAVLHKDSWGEVTPRETS